MKGAYVLVVEDNVDLAENLAEIFEDEGAVVRLASNATEAEALAHEERFDLVAVDMRLGKDSGLDLVPRLKRLNSYGEVILMTGNATLDSAIQAIRRGVFAYVQKPFAPDQIVTLAKRALAQVALRREKQALAARLEASEALYRNVIETVEACIIGIDRQGTIRFANRHTTECTGRDMDVIVGSKFEALWRDAGGVSDVHDYLERALRGTPVRDVERSLKRGDGIHRTVRWSLACLENQESSTGDEQAAVVLAVGLDVTERVELEKRSAENQALAAMGTLTTGLAHEIRNPLNAAKLQLELLTRRARREATDENAAARIVQPAEIVRSEIERLTELLNEFLQLARPRALERAPIRVEALFGEITLLQQPVVEAANMTLSTRVEPSHLTVRGDESRLKQVVINLLGNAVDAMRERGHGSVELAAELMDDDEVRITVTDNGPGIAPDVADQAFQPFVTNKEAGTGLGLAIVKTIVERHGGSVALLPAQGGGAVAEIVLPGGNGSSPPVPA